jgi:hypothetical protein
VAVETVGNWYWIVDEIEAAGMVPHLVHARKAKLIPGGPWASRFGFAARGRRKERLMPPHPGNRNNRATKDRSVTSTHGATGTHSHQWSGQMEASFKKLTSHTNAVRSAI